MLARNCLSCRLPITNIGYGYPLQIGCLESIIRPYTKPPHFKAPISCTEVGGQRSKKQSSLIWTFLHTRPKRRTNFKGIAQVVRHVRVHVNDAPPLLATNTKSAATNPVSTGSLPFISSHLVLIHRRSHQCTFLLSSTPSFNNIYLLTN